MTSKALRDINLIRWFSAADFLVTSHYRFPTGEAYTRHNGGYLGVMPHCRATQKQQTINGKYEF